MEGSQEINKMSTKGRNSCANIKIYSGDDLYILLLAVKAFMDRPENKNNKFLKSLYKNIKTRLDFLNVRLD
jgi:hypothetical protein